MIMPSRVTGYGISNWYVDWDKQKILLGVFHSSWGFFARLSGVNFSDYINDEFSKGNFEPLLLFCKLQGREVPTVTYLKPCRT